MTLDRADLFSDAKNKSNELLQITRDEEKKAMALYNCRT